MQSSKEDNMAFNITPFSFVKHKRKRSTAQCIDIFEQFAIASSKGKHSWGCINTCCAAGMTLS